MKQFVRGDNAVAVQVAGSSNAVTISLGGSKLPLDQPHKRRGAAAPATERQLLLTEWRATTLVGRKAELAALSAWRGSGAPIAIRCIIGRAGSGKTRLAIEACEQAESDGWKAGFVTGEDLRLCHDVQDLAQWNARKNTLIVIDDAAASAGILKKWFNALARRPASKGKQKLRFLLLERHADSSSDYGWWAELKRSDDRDRIGAGDLIGTEQPVELSIIADPEQRRALLAEAMRLAAGFLGTPPVAPPQLGEDLSFDQRLADDRLENEPLFLMMAGIVAAEQGAPAALSLGRIELAKVMAGLERDRLKRLGMSRDPAVDGALLAHLAATVTLQRGCPFEMAAALVAEELAAMGLASPVSPEALVELLSEALPSPTGAGLDRVRPDLIGEAFILNSVFGSPARPEATRLAIVERAHARRPQGALETLVLAAQDYAAGDADHPAVRWLAELTNRSTNLGQLMPIADSIPSSTLALRELGVVVERRIADLLRELESDDVLPFLPLALNKLGIRLSATGQHEEAMNATQESVTIYRRLAKVRPALFQERLAASLGSLANRLNYLGRRKAALDASREAVDIFRALVDGSDSPPDTLIMSLAVSLNGLSNQLANLGYAGPALEAALEAVSLRRPLVAKNPEVFGPRLPGALINLSSCLAEVGKTEEALAAAQEAADRYRTLAAMNPDAFRPDYAISLSNLASRLKEAGQPEAAVTSAEQAVAIRRVLAASRPGAFNSVLATSLNNLSNFLSAVGRHEDALAAVQAAVDLLRPLAKVSPDAANPRLATSLSVRGDMLEANGRLVEAVDSDREAVVTLASSFTTLPATFASQMALFVRDYLRRAQAAGIEPDFELLSPIMATIQELREEQDNAD